MPGAVMLEMATSAGHCMLSVDGSARTEPMKSSVASLLDVSLPFPLVLNHSHNSNTVTSVSLDTTSSMIKVHAKKDGNAVQSTHLIGRLATTQIKNAAEISGLDVAMMPWGWTSPNTYRMQPPAAVAVVVHTSTGQDGQYSIHPAVLDNCTQVLNPSFCADLGVPVLL